MLSIDTNILLYAFNEDSPNHADAFAWLGSVQALEEVALSEFVLAELYVLLRSPAVLKRPLEASDAVEVIQTYRRHPRWRIIGFPLESRALHDAFWQKARQKNFSFRRLYDARTALTILAQGVTDFATANVKDYENLGFRKVWNPLAG